MPRIKMGSYNMIVYNKLVRDKIPQIIEASGQICEAKVLLDDDYKDLLVFKLHEELEEFQTAEEEKQIEELADLVEVVYAILESKGVGVEEFEKIRLKKREERGGFKEKLLLVSVSENEKEKIFKHYSSKIQLVAREINEYIIENFEGIKIKTPITDCIGYKIGGSKKFASLTIQDRHSLILHVGNKGDNLGIRLQEEIDNVLGHRFPRTKTDNSKYSHQAFIKLEWVNEIEQIKPLILKAYELRKSGNSEPTTSVHDNLN
jgi:predicted house-cleaning noncanonical NTP pyrophosphatase (MazG superfamily)